MKKLAILALAVSAVAAQAQFVVVPNAYANTVAPGGAGLNTAIRDANNPRTMQLLIRSTQLAGVNVGDQITGISFRLYSGATSTFPAAAATWSDYSITMGQAVDPLSGTTTFLSNFVGSTSLVRSGALTIPQDAFSFGGSPNAWGTTISFTTPYTYTGGNLGIMVQHSGSNITNGTDDFLEAVLTTEAGYAAGDYRSYTATGNTATTGALANFTVTRLSVTPVPEPASMAALGLGALALIRKRRSKKA